MRTLQKLISAGFATCAFAAASMPALSWTTLGTVDAGPAMAAATPSPDDEASPQGVILVALHTLDLDRR